MTETFLSRRRFAYLAGAGAATVLDGMSARPGTVSLFDGKTLDKWVLLENTVYRVSRYDISDPAIFIAKIAKSADPVSKFIRGAVQESLRMDLTTYSVGSHQENVTLPALVNELNRLLAGASIYDAARFRAVTLRPETSRLLAQELPWTAASSSQ